MVGTSRHLGIALQAVLCLLAADAFCAEPYPSRPIRLLVPYAAGGATDITSRILAPRLSESLGQQVVVDNRPGGNGILAADLVARAAPDGYTIIMANISFGASPGLYSKLPFDAEKDFAPISLVMLIPTVLALHPSVPARSVKDLIALAKSKPGYLNYGSAGSGSANHLAGELFKYMTGTALVHIPYKGGGPAVIAILTGEISVLFATISSALEHFKSGRLIALGVSTPKRNSALPNVPTISESGLPGFEVSTWNGLLAPAGTPRPVVDRLHRETVNALANSNVRSVISGLGADIVGSGSEEFATFIKTEIARWSKVAKAGGIKGD